MPEPLKPITHKMCDAARYFILYQQGSDCNFDFARKQLEEGNHPTCKQIQNGQGHITKSEVAEIIYQLMQNERLGLTQNGVWKDAN